MLVHSSGFYYIYMIALRNLDSFIMFIEFWISIYVLIIQLLFHKYL